MQFLFVNVVKLLNIFRKKLFKAFMKVLLFLHFNIKRLPLPKYILLNLLRLPFCVGVGLDVERCIFIRKFTSIFKDNRTFLQMNEGITFLPRLNRKYLYEQVFFFLLNVVYGCSLILQFITCLKKQKHLIWSDRRQYITRFIRTNDPETQNTNVKSLEAKTIILTIYSSHLNTKWY